MRHAWLHERILGANGLDFFQADQLTAQYLQPTSPTPGLPMTVSSTRERHSCASHVQSIFPFRLGIPVGISICQWLSWTLNMFFLSFCLQSVNGKKKTFNLLLGQIKLLFPQTSSSRLYIVLPLASCSFTHTYSSAFPPFSRWAISASSSIFFSCIHVLSFSLSMCIIIWLQCKALFKFTSWKPKRIFYSAESRKDPHLLLPLHHVSNLSSSCVEILLSCPTFLCVTLVYLRSRHTHTHTHMRCVWKNHTIT